MGNCQAIDTATLVIQHPCGKVEKQYWPVTANEIMRMNPGHYVALLISTTLCPSKTNNKDNLPQTTTTTTTTTINNSHGNSSVRLTRIKLLRPTDTLVLGQVYRLITTQEVMKGLWAKKCAKMKKNMAESAQNDGYRREPIVSKRSDVEKENQVSTKHERHRPRMPAANPGGLKSRAWQPSLKSITEASS